jgi:hypothetical protein
MEHAGQYICHQVVHGKDAIDIVKALTDASWWTGKWRAGSDPRSALRKDSSAVYQKVYRLWLTALRRIQVIR